MIARRAFVTGSACLAVAGAGRAALPVPDAKRLAFDVIRNGTKIGAHFLDFEPNGDQLTVRIAADIAIGVGPFTFFRYKHRATERWEAGQVVSLDAETDDDGSPGHARIWREGAALLVEGSVGPRYTAPSGAQPATHWNRHMLDGPMINTQNGKLMRPVIVSLGIEANAQGLSRPAEHFTLRGDADLDTWYDPFPSWVGLNFTAHDGSSIRYQLA